MSRVLIVNMPFSNLRWPNIGPSLLKAALVRRAIGCDVAYLNFAFAERVGIDRYEWIADYFAFVLGGERLFAKHYFEGRLPEDESYCRDVLLHADPGLTETDRRDYEETEQHVEPFLDECMDLIDWSRYAVVGFAMSFQQTMASMALARRIKHERPEIQIMVGGAACEAEMGIELARQFPWIDYVFLGEADLTFPPVVEQVLHGETPKIPPGEIARESGTPSPPDPAAFMVRDMDALPYPDFDDYFQRLRASPLKDHIHSLLFFETSRGCWWGQKHHCKFCGLNGSTLAYRSKSPRRAVDELRHLVERYGVHEACSSDNILDHRYFNTFLPMLKEANLDLAFVFEMKTNLSRRQVEALMEAGMGAAQLGIETFITPVLKLIGKGANAVQNLQTLKWFSEYDVEVKWNLLYGFPGENPRDYAGLAELIPSIVHMAPPLAVGRVRMDRFAPYFEDPAAYGMKNARPNRAFRHVYPFPAEVLARMAYYFEYDYADGRNPLDYASPVLEAVETWQGLKGTVTLRSWDRSDGVLILNDTRPSAVVFQRRLTGIDRRLYLHCDTGRSLESVLRFVAQHADNLPPDESAVRRTLDTWVNQRIMARLDDRYLSLALRARSDDGGNDR
ncbi:MAG: RiPP maturation radical SAM C-methyltransferase [Planctomycetota bacterium]